MIAQKLPGVRCMTILNRLLERRKWAVRLVNMEGKFFMMTRDVPRGFFICFVTFDGKIEGSVMGAYQFRKTLSLEKAGA